MENNRLNREDLLKLLPEIELLANQELKQQCIDTILYAMGSGGWNKDNLDRCPVSLTRVSNSELNSQFDHIRVVLKIALGILESINEIYKEKIDGRVRDLVIAGALLHDVGKFVEFVPHNNEVRYANNAKLLRHPLSGAIIAAQEKLPDDVIHIIATHSFEGQASYESIASIIVKTADEVAFKYITYFNK